MLEKEDLLSDSECFCSAAEELPNTAPLNTQDILLDSEAEDDSGDHSWGWLQPKSFFSFEPIGKLPFPILVCCDCVNGILAINPFCSRLEAVPVMFCIVHSVDKLGVQFRQVAQV